MELPLNPFSNFLSRKEIRQGETFNIELVVTSQAISASTVRIRLFTRDGISKFTHSNTSTGLAQTSTHKISDFPVYLSVTDDAGVLRQGDIFVTVSLRINGEVVAVLTSGQVYRQKGISWPVANTADVFPSRGGIRIFTGTDPAAGVNMGESVPSGQMWKILWIKFALVTDATAANRRVHIHIDNNSFDGPDYHAASDQTASLTRNYTVAHIGGALSETNDNDIIIPMDDSCYILGSGLVRTEILNLQAGDNLTAPTFCVEQLFTEEF